MRTTRRAVLAGGLLLPLAACTGSEGPPAQPAPVDPDVALRAAAVQRERQLLATYDAALLRDPARADRLSPLRAEHATHLAALGEQEAPATTSAAPASPAAPRAAPPADDLANDLANDLAAAERAAAAAHAEATATASPGLAAVLAQLAASEASHPVALA